MEFHDDAIVLSGETGTKLKCQILGRYYPQWWNITSGGRRRDFKFPTAVVEMNSGTGLDYIEDTTEIIRGSAGHALDLKLNGKNDTSNLKVVLVEEDPNCFSHLKNAIKWNWQLLDPNQTTGPIEQNSNGVYCFHKSQWDALDLIEKLDLGNSLFFFDPLLYTPWEQLERVAFRRINRYYKTGTEFIVFTFTSDWFAGRRKLGLDPLPFSTDEKGWITGETKTVSKMDEMFGNDSWRNEILVQAPIEYRVQKLVEAYRKRLHKWFRYVLPMPFNPKGDQYYHLFMCSNYETGVRLTRRFYERFSNNPPYAPDGEAMLAEFVKHDRNLIPSSTEGKKSLVWRMLRNIIKQHDEGLCDFLCSDFKNIAGFEWPKIQPCLETLQSSKYLIHIRQMTDAWENPPQLYKLDWQVAKEKLNVDPPPQFRPLTPELLKELKENEAEKQISRRKIPKTDASLSDLRQWFGS